MDYVAQERRTRIRLLLAAYSYERGQGNYMTDAEFDALAETSNPFIETGRYDEWWTEHFTPYTGSWVHGFPDLQGLERLHDRLVLTGVIGVRQNVPKTDLTDDPFSLNDL